jgi:hypothetical protein
VTDPLSAGWTIPAENIAEWKGQDVLDPDGSKLGKLEDVLYDAETDVPAFAAVKSGKIGKHLTLVPLTGASVGPDHVRLQYRKSEVKDAPSYDTDAELSVKDEADAFDYFGIAYSTAGQGARRLAKR